MTPHVPSLTQEVTCRYGLERRRADRELWIERITPLITNGNVTGYRGTDGNDSSNASTFTLHVLCYPG